ncbi:DEAD/DEAH box helicase [Evansella tamaricis]|uniref:DEAD/DEAH box helicase n=1 Tax=Evansella tamaricis TaxID=2069301 RepID=A0ABS6JK62_9BACI|nr:DEAD/DEAH box helicase [Evansella tamaricis]MBU9713589.1 DEAD/DEAH box helicase [Evansella tamaricis]
MKINQISEFEIKNLCSEMILRRGKNYFYRGDVKDIHWNVEEDIYQARVDGSEPYNVKLQVGKDKQLDGFSCTCPAFGKYPGICKHVVATLFELKQRIQQEEEREESGKSHFSLQEKQAEVRIEGKRERQIHNVGFIEERKTTELISSFQQIYMKKQETYQEREVLQIEYRIKLFPKIYRHLTGSIELELKVGPKRLYVVRDLKEFLRCYHEERTLKFAKLFTYDPSDYVFSEEDKAILSWLWRLYHLKDEHRKDPFFTRKNYSEDSRSVDIPAPTVLELLEELRDRKVIVEVHGFEYIGFDFVHGKLPLKFTMEDSVRHKGQFHFKWDNEEEISFFGTDYQVIFHRGTFYELERDQGESINLLMTHLTDYHPAEVTITQDQLENFSSLVLPQLKNIGEVDVKESIREKIHIAPLKGKLYVDYQGERLTAELLFQYGEEQYSPFETSQPYNGKVTVRDVEKELFLLSHVEKVPFKYNGKELYLEEFDDILDFVMDVLPQLSQWIDVFATSQVKGLLYEPTERPTIQVDTNERLNLLDVAFKMEGIDETEIDEVLKALLENKKYYRLETGSFVNLQDTEFQEMKGILEDLEMEASAQHHVNIPLLKAFHLAEDNGMSIKKGKAFRELVERILHPEEVEAQIPQTLDPILRDYQKIGFQWLMSLSHYGFGGVLADDMGLGKTLQMITYLVAKKSILSKEGKDFGKTLIICPSSLVYNWQKEIERFAPDLSSVVISGSVQERQLAFGEAESKEIWITSYPLLRRDLEMYVEREFSTLILDEAQYVKNDWTKTSKAVKGIRAKQSFALSGTPIENSLNELYSIFDLVLPGLFKNKSSFKELDQEKVAKRIRPFVLRRLKKDVLTELPEKMESVQYTELTDQQKRTYLAQLRLIQDDAKAAINGDAFQENRMKILAGLTRLRQICCHPRLFMKDYEGGSGKMDRLFEYLEEAIASGRRVVLFSQFTQMLSLIRNQLENYSWKYHYLDGSTPSKERIELADRFNNGEKELFLISLKAGGTGLNLTGGDTVILFDSWWNPAVEEQAADRVYRFGQKNVVQVTKLITTGTIEEKIHKLQEQKRELLDRVIQPGEKMISSLTKEDIEELLDI